MKHLATDHKQERPKIAFLLPDFAGGGAERNTLRLARRLLERGHPVDLIVHRPDGPLRAEVPAAAAIVPLAGGSPWHAKLLAVRADPAGIPRLLWPVLLPRRPVGAYLSLPSLVRYLRRARPAVLISAFPYNNLLAIAARRAAGVTTCIVVTEHNTKTEASRRQGKRKRRGLSALIGRAYRRADAVVAVSDGLADHVAQTYGLPRDRITTIYNPVVDEALAVAAAEPIDHPWFALGSLLLF
jgi:glycosyltransferase involved in cell wall biosynthesis